MSSIAALARLGSRAPAPVRGPLATTGADPNGPVVATLPNPYIVVLEAALPYVGVAIAAGLAGYYVASRKHESCQGDLLAYLDRSRVEHGEDAADLRMKAAGTKGREGAELHRSAMTSFGKALAYDEIGRRIRRGVPQR